MISIVAAIGKNNEIGKKNGLLWHIPEELRHFKEVTWGHPIIMGRKTYQSIGRALPGRTSIVISRKESLILVPGVIQASSLEQALELAKKQKGSEEIFVIGGASIFEQALPHSDKLYITIVNAQFPEADAYFPDFSEFRNKKLIKKGKDKNFEFGFYEFMR